MQTFHPGAGRGRGTTDRLDARYTFSFGQFHDPHRMGFGPLRVLNENCIAPDGSIAMHRHANMEILTWVIAGRLGHRDSLGTDSTVGAGELQRMSAGSGIEHSEFNASQNEAVHFLQIWIQPDRVNGKPSYARAAFDPAARRDRWCMLASRDGVAGALAVQQDMRLDVADLAAGARLTRLLDTTRSYWLQVAGGSLAAGEQRLGPGDALALTGETTLTLSAERESQVLLFELPADR